MQESHSVKLADILARARRPQRQAAQRDAPSGQYTLSRLDTVDLDLLGLRDDDRYLDVGCGTGRHFVNACRRRCVAVGLDMNRTELEMLKFFAYCLGLEGGLRGRPNALVGDALRIPFRDASFDRVICTEVLEHVPDERVVMAELARVLKPGGTIAVSVPATTSERLVWRIAAIRRIPPGEHVRLFRPGQVARLLQSNGLEVYAQRARHSLETPYWLLWLWGREGGLSRRLCAVWKDFLDANVERSRLLTGIETAGNHILPKSAVYYARKARQEATSCG